MRACHIVYGYFPFDSRVRKEGTTLQGFGHEIDVIALQEPGEAREETVGGFHVYRIPMAIVRGGFARYGYQYLVFLLASTALLIRLFLRWRYRAVHIHSLPDFQVFCAAPLRLLGVSAILDLHEAMPEIFAARFNIGIRSLKVRIARALEWISCAFATVVIVQNDAMSDLLVGRGVSAAKIVVIMNSPDLTTTARSPDKEIQSVLGIRGQRAIVYVGGINRERDLENLVRAVARLRRSHPVKLFVFGYGDDNYRHQLAETARIEGLEKDFVMGPRVPAQRVIDYLSLSEVGPVTYERNPLTELTVPNKVFEYAAARKPLVIADLTTLRNLFEGAALFYRPGDFEDLANQMERLLDDPDLGRFLALKADEVLQRCGWGVMTERLRSVYKQLSSSEV